MQGLRFVLKLPIYLMVWAGVVAVKLPTALSGLLMVALLYPYRYKDYATLPFWTRPWANPEDWEGAEGAYGRDSLPMWWVKKEGTSFKSWYRYHAIRNPANGLRSFSWFSARIVPEEVRFIRSKNWSMPTYWPHKVREAGHSTVWYVAWQGWKMGCELVHIWSDERHLDIKIGFRVDPGDIYDAELNLGKTNASFASKVLLYRKG